MAYSTPATATSGGVASASMWNTGVRDNLDAVSNWTSYTPALTQGAAVTKTTTYAKYRKFGTTCVVIGFLTSTGAGTTSSAVVVGLPSGATASTPALSIVGSGEGVGSATTYPFVSIINTSTTICFHRTDTNPTGNWGADPAFALVNTNTIKWKIEYETT